MQKWHKALSFILVSTLLGCGFKPIHYNSENSINKLAAISIKPTSSGKENSKLAWEFNKILSTELQQNASTANSPVYSLQTALSSSLSDAVIQSDSTVSRKNINISLNYQVIKISDSKVIANGVVASTDSFNVTDAPFSNYVTEQQSKSKLLASIATDLRHRLYTLD